MSLNNIQLNPVLLADLYPHSLVETSITTNTPTKSIKFLGNNKKNILLIVSKDNVAYLEDEELSFLSNILGACKLSLADIAIVNEKRLPEETTYIDLIKELNSRSVLLFDVPSQSIDLPFNFPQFQIQVFDQRSYLSAPSLKEIESDKSLKAALWGCLKNLFSL